MKSYTKVTDNSFPVEKITAAEKLRQLLQITPTVQPFLSQRCYIPHPARLNFTTGVNLTCFGDKSNYFRGKNDVPVSEKAGITFQALSAILPDLR